MIRVVAIAIISALTLAAQRSPADAASSKTVEAANRFLALLTPQQRAVVQLALNKETRSKWSNLPTAPGYTSLRNGIRMAELNPAQQEAALALVAAPLSRSGYQKVLDIIGAEEARMRSIGNTGTGANRFETAEFQIAILGKPSLSSPWMIQFGGHHLALNITVAGTANVLTPLHTGAEPMTYSLNGQVIRPLGHETDKAFALMNALNPEQRKKAILNYQVADTVLGPGHDDEVIQPEGLQGSALNSNQQRMLLDLINEWVSILNVTSAAARMAEIRSAIGKTWFAWSGPVTNGSASYFRIQGPAVEIEYAPQDGTANHVHTFYRDPTNDYGKKLIKQ